MVQYIRTALACLLELGACSRPPRTDEQLTGRAEQAVDRKLGIQAQFSLVEATVSQQIACGHATVPRRHSLIVSGSSCSIVSRSSCPAPSPFAIGAAFPSDCLRRARRPQAAAQEADTAGLSRRDRVAPPGRVSNPAGHRASPQKAMGSG